MVKSQSSLDILTMITPFINILIDESSDTLRGDYNYFFIFLIIKIRLQI